MIKKMTPGEFRYLLDVCLLRVDAAYGRMSAACGRCVWTYVCCVWTQLIVEEMFADCELKLFTGHEETNLLQTD
jgi:hypothetical protein